MIRFSVEELAPLTYPFARGTVDRGTDWGERNTHNAVTRIAGCHTRAPRTPNKTPALAPGNFDLACGRSGGTLQGGQNEMGGTSCHPFLFALFSKTPNVLLQAKAIRRTTASTSPWRAPSAICAAREPLRSWVQAPPLLAAPAARLPRQCAQPMRSRPAAAQRQSQQARQAKVELSALPQETP